VDSRRREGKHCREVISGSSVGGTGDVRRALSLERRARLKEIEEGVKGGQG